MTIEVNRFDSKAVRAMVKQGEKREKNAKSYAASRMHANAVLLATLHAANPEWAQRLDSRSRQNAGLHSARQLEQILAEVDRTDYPVNNWLELIPIESGVAPGADSFTVQRIDMTGRPKVHKGKGNDTPTVSVAMSEQNYKVRAYTLAAEWDYFEALASDYANTNLQVELLTATRDSHLEFANEKTGLGDEDNQILGVFNNPYVNKVVVAVIFDEGTPGDDMLAALNRVANFPNRISKGTRRPSRLLVSTRIDDIISSTPRGAGTDLSVKEVFLRNNPYIRDVIGIHELDGIGGDNVDGMFAYSPEDKKSCVNYIPIQYTQLPVQMVDYESRIPTLMTHGGVVMRKPLSNIVAYVPVTPA